MYQRSLSILKIRPKKVAAKDFQEETICGIPVNSCLSLSEESMTAQDGCLSVREIEQMYLRGLPTPTPRKGRYSDSEGFDPAIDSATLPFEVVGTLQKNLVDSAKAKMKQQQEEESYARFLEEETKSQQQEVKESKQQEVKESE